MSKPEFKDQIIEVEEKIRQVLKPSRYTHSLGVAYTAASLAMCHDLNMQHALLAGLLHDYAKALTEDEQVRQCDDKGIKLTACERRNPAVIHGKLSAWYAEHEFGITNKDILNAIRYHTTGRPEMSDLEMIVFVADYIEPARTGLPNLMELRQIAYYDLYDCAYQICDGILDYLKRSGKEIDPMTKKTQNYLKEIL